MPKAAAANYRFDLTGKVALICGGGGALGAAVGRGFAQHGADVAIADLRPEAAEAAAAACAATGAKRTLALPLDLTREADVDAAVHQVSEKLGGLDILVTVAGSGVGRPVLEMTLEEFNHSLGLYLSGAFLACRAAGRQMVRQGRGGSVINVSSIASLVALGRGTAGYAAAKAGLNALTREAALEWAPHRIRVNAIAPSQFRTPALDKVLDDPKLGGRETLSAKMLANIPLGRFGEPEDLVGPCIFLACDAAAMVTGHVMLVDGGYTIR